MLLLVFVALPSPRDGFVQILDFRFNTLQETYLILQEDRIPKRQGSSMINRTLQPILVGDQIHILRERHRRHFLRIANVGFIEDNGNDPVTLLHEFCLLPDKLCFQFTQSSLRRAP